MSIATEITRLQNAKADIKTAIESKGVTVPSSAKLDVYNTYIAQLGGKLIGSGLSHEETESGTTHRYNTISISIPAGVTSIKVLCTGTSRGTTPPSALPVASGSIIVQNASFTSVGTMTYADSITIWKSGVITLNGNAGTITITCDTNAGLGNSVASLMSTWVLENISD